MGIRIIDISELSEGSVVVSGHRPPPKGKGKKPKKKKPSSPKKRKKTVPKRKKKK